MPQTIPQEQCVWAGCEPGVQRCSQPQIDCDSVHTSDFALNARLTTKKSVPVPVLAKSCSLPLEVHQQICANGEDVEWSLCMKNIRVTSIFLAKDATIDRAVKLLLKKAVA